MNRRSIIVILLAVLIYVFSTGVSYTFFSQESSLQSVKTPLPSPHGASNGGLQFDASLPKTENCPLNGALYSKEQREWWEKHRPLGVMIENHEEARPQSGLSSADVIYEAVAEGAITRFLAVYYCQDAKVIGPVRSARTYFLDFISEYGDYPLYAHVGGANTPGPANALGQIEGYGWNAYSDLSQFALGCPVYCQDRTRLPDVAIEHTMYSGTTKLWEVAAKKRELTNVDKDGNAWDADFKPYVFKDDADKSGRGNGQKIHIELWEDYKEYAIDWMYDPLSNLYLRENGGKKHMDKNTNKQLNAKNVVVLYMQQSNANDGYENNLHLLYKTKGSGKAAFFIDGKKVNGTWRKDTRISRTMLFDETGNSIKLNKGFIWFEILPTDGILTVN